MSANTGYAICVVVFLMFLGSIVLSLHWDEQNKVTAEFTKQCNDRGGIAKYESSILQCIGAKQPEPTHDR